jgi:RecB family exonuclease
MTLVGLVEGEWPERPTRNIFFPPFLLASLGWPAEKDRRGAAVARFVELLQSPRRRVAVSTVTLDEESLVEPSLLVDEIPAARLTTTRVAPLQAGADSDGQDTHDPGNQWLALRSSRSAADAAMFHGQTGPLASKPWAISALETYLDCPFRFFAKHVVRLEEEPDDEEVMDPRRRGQFVHEVFEAFFDRWQREGNQAITPRTIDAAWAVFREVVETLIGQWQLPGTEAALERTRLVGSAAAAGLGEAVLRMEAERPVPVIARLLEHRLTGEFTFATAGGPRRLAIKGKADRIDLLDDGTFRLVDYKLGWPPNRARALQLPIYALCAEQTLTQYRGRRWTLREAAYLAFKGPKRVVGLFSTDAERIRVLDEAQQRLVDTVDAIGAGRFPPAPDDVYRCETCSYAAVCRKDYVGDI